MNWLDKLTEPTESTKALARNSVRVHLNEAIELVREIRDTSVLPEDMPEQLQKILTALSIVKADLLIKE